MDWTVKGLEESKKILDGWYDYIGDDTAADGEPDSGFVAALSDDLNTPRALTRLHELRAPASGFQQIEQKRVLKATASLIGLLGCTKREYLESQPHTIVVDEDKVEDLIASRNAARAAKNFQESDRIRDELAAMGVVLKDSKDGTTWEVAR
jgi:cysteinyl-tRNA synthetase